MVAIKIRQNKFKQAFDKSTSSNAIRSTRRVLFNHLNLSIEERGHFHVDQMYGSGTGIIIKFQEKFFLLTADHVIRKATEFKFNNPSPFWVTSHSKYNVKTIYDFLMPAKAFHIGELISNEGLLVDSSDIVLIELFYPGHYHLPDHFLDFDRKTQLLRKDEFFEGQLLLAAGYPFEKNDFEFFNEPVGNFTHATPVHRYIVDGVCKFERNEPYMTLNGISEKSYGNLSGLSGGIVTNIQKKANQVKMAGMVLTAGPKVIRFLPSYIIEYALKNYTKATKSIIDPSVNHEFSFDEIVLLLKKYFEVAKKQA